MKIRSVRATPVMVPVRAIQPKPWIKRTHIDRTIVEVETECGLVGIGETRGIWSAAIINERFAPALLGSPVLERGSARRRCLDRNFDHGFPERLLDLTAFAAIDLALWDLAGKQAGLPVYRLLGGAVRDHAPFVAYGYPADPSDGHAERDIPQIMSDLAVRQLAKTGASLFEFKIGRHSVACDIETVRTVRDAVGSDIDIAVDANMNYDIFQARQFLEQTRDAHLVNVEEPVATLRETALLRSDSGIAMSTHCTLLDAVSAYPAIDSVVFDLHGKGGIESAAQFASQVEALGKSCWLRAAWELGVSFAAMCHLVMAVPQFSRPSQALMAFPVDDLIEGEAWLVESGGCRPPDTPGLGIGLDREALARYRVQ